jgi:hypothetical protein
MSGRVKSETIGGFDTYSAHKRKVVDGLQRDVAVGQFEMRMDGFRAVYERAIASSATRTCGWSWR